jgi:hypothetical protein
MKTRIYVVHSTAEGEGPRLVTAVSQAQAIGYVASKYTAVVASQTELVTLLGQGLKVEEAGNE